MHDNRYVLRELRDSDYDALLRVQNAINPDEPESAESFRHGMESFRKFSDLPFIVALDRASAEILGSGVLFERTEQRDPVKLWAHIGVLPGRRREGIGSLLYDTLVAEARRRGATALRCSVDANSSPGMAFVAKRNFVERRRSWRSSLDVASADTSELAALIETLSASGIEFTTLSREGVNNRDVLLRVYELDVVTARDEPHVGAPTTVPFEEYRQVFLEGPMVLREAWFLAKKGATYIGTSYAAREPAQPKVLLQYYTGVRREYRRKRLALALKLMLIEYARQEGYARIVTNNDSSNVPMWSLNQRLGFRILRERIHLECELAGYARKQGPRPG